VASVFHLGRKGREYFYAMEFVEGETLDSLIKRSGALEVKRALEITMQVAAGLAAVHRKKLVHRDIKPSNIMVSFEEEGDSQIAGSSTVCWVACFKSLGLRALIRNCFWPSGALARSLTDRKSTGNRNDLVRAVIIHQVPEFQILGL
jgi:serine/threonine protein kinase